MPIVILHPLLKAIIIALLHIAAPRVRPRLARVHTFVNSFGGGLAITYVLLVMLPELDMGNDLFDRRIYLLVLMGFVLVNGTERMHESFVLRVSDYSAAISYRAIYGWLLILGMPEAVTESNIHFALLTVAISLHLMYSDYDLGMKHPEFDRSGRFVLSGALILGWIRRVYLPIESQAMTDSITALLAGTVVYLVCKDELPEVKSNNYVWFLLCIITYAAVVIATELTK